MQNIQEVFNLIQEAKKEIKEIRAEYRDALAQTDKHAELIEEIKKLREEKKGIETRVQLEMGKRYERMEDIKIELAANEQLLNDIAITTLMDGKTVEVTDEYKNNYEPLYIVRFKKTNVIKKEEF